MVISTYKITRPCTMQTQTKGTTFFEVLLATFISVSVSTFLLSNYARTQYLLDILKSTQQEHQVRLVKSKAILLYDDYEQTWLDVKALESITPI